MCPKVLISNGVLNSHLIKFICGLYILDVCVLCQQPKTGCPLKLRRVSLVSTWMGDLQGKTRLLLEEVLVRPAGGAHPVVCVGPKTSL